MNRNLNISSCTGKTWKIQIPQNIGQSSGCQKFIKAKPVSFFFIKKQEYFFREMDFSVKTRKM